ncbi:nitrous oxide-stimulated promoter family protein [Vibrio sp. TH_r3]|uniref:nitrous oxide-stimulated promoter family protein n=1 Tax=Vibrio sp. TH_r3 TaxID=3082084 RepID=UPI0029547187|nr:nitrous oxide-stimulated promoter family protein [Vibrio sp. TH_r3]MDV7103481.1 nitrous oxide-stimulated promoter family protein [Vibrio sp. TH_r3]
MKQSEILQGRLNTEFKTVSAMVENYCRRVHLTKQGLCEDCHQLLMYAETKLDRCPYGQEKPTCNKCPIHCYKPEPKEQMRIIMRYSGPQMLLSHPLLALRHLFYEKRKVPTTVPVNASNRFKRLKMKH